MKKLLIILLILPLWGLVNCVKQKNCDCADVEKGKFIYLDEPVSPSKPNGKKTVAYFFPDVPRSGIESTCWIIGTVPKNYQKADTLYVNVCLEEIIIRGSHKDYTLTYYKIKCIEKED